MEFYLNFDKPHVSEKVFNFLEININEENAKKNLARLAKGQKLLYKEANEFIHTLLKALTIEDGKEDLPFVPSKINEGEKGDSQVDSPPIQPLTQPGTSGAQQAKGSEKNNKEIPSVIDADKKLICHFYTINKCKFGKECRKDHPKICIKFKKHGLKKFNKNGCEESCVDYHPKACFEAMKSKTCKRPDCKFFHVSGTKKSEAVTSNQVPVPTSNSFSPIASNSSNTEQVFHKDKEPWEQAIEKMAVQMEMMMKWQQMLMNQHYYYY